MKQRYKKQNPRKIILPAATILLLATMFAFWNQHNLGLPPDRKIIIGSVTDYNPNPLLQDAGPIYKINNVQIDIGGGLRPNKPYGKVDDNAKAIGQKVEARVRVQKLNNGQNYYTVYDCKDCYVKVRN
jgi:hypothetical protein